MMAAGLLLAVAAVLISSEALEQALRGQATGRLAWGPALFRLLLALHGLALAILGWWKWQRPAAAREARGAAPAISPVVMALMGLMTLAAAALRLYRLASQLWYDEVLTLVECVRLPLGEIVSSFPSQNQHMLYSILARFAFDVFGESPSTLRLPAVLFGVLSVWALFALGAKLANIRTALLACALMTFSYHHIWFSQNGRGYTGLLFFAILATWIWIEAVERDAWNWWMGYALAVFLGMWVQMTMLFVVAGHGLVFLSMLAWPRRFPHRAGRKAVAAWLVAGTVSLQVYALSLPEFLHSAAGEVSMPSDWTNPLWLVTETLRNLTVIPGGVVAILGGGAVFLLGWWEIFRRNANAAYVMTLPAAICGVTMVALGHNLWPRFFFFSMGFALLFVVVGALRLPHLAAVLFGRFKGREPLLTRAGTGIALLLVAASAATSGKAFLLPKQDFLGARAYVEQNRESGDAVVVVGLAAKAYGDYYAPEWRSSNSPAELDEIRHYYRRIWLVYTLPVQLQGFHPELWAKIQTDFAVARIFPGTLGGGEVYVCRERQSP
jgi:mannosyltransferase